MVDILLALWNMLPSTLMMAAPILIAATGGMICERAGVVNIALEGLMAIGAMAAATTHVLLESSFSLSIPLAFIIAAVLGLVDFLLLLGVQTIF